jgi:hypothetical protein
VAEWVIESSSSVSGCNSSGSISAGSTAGTEPQPMAACLEAMAEPSGGPVVPLHNLRQAAQQAPSELQIHFGVMGHEQVLVGMRQGACCPRGC